MTGVLSFSDFCEQSGLPLWLRDGMLEELTNREKARHAVAQVRAQSRAAAPERAPLTDERGDSWGHVEATIDAESFYYWAARPDVGPDAWNDETFLREYLRDNPSARVRTVPSHCTVRNSWDQGRGIAPQWRGPVRSVTVYR